ncbi:MAG TPA: RNA polymerase sigma factor [Saprospiraceae bacterium]|nr:RNA polymerase sigma factor [Saprospiraceae bacterium]
MNEKSLISLLKAGDNSGFRELIALYKDRVYNTCLSLLQNIEDSQDITQEVFIEIHRSIHSFKAESKLSTWIYRIALTKSLELIRKKKTKKRFGRVESLWSNTSNEIEDKTDFYHPGISLENKERSAILFKAIDKLPVNQKTAFIMHKTEDLSYTEIADIMELSVSSIESLMFRAKQNLQKLLSDYYYKNEV